MRVQGVDVCFLCGEEGEKLYSHMRDRLFGSPGSWDIRRCSGCGVAWLDPRPLPEEIEKLYQRYYTHPSSEEPSIRESPLRETVKRGVLAASCGYVETAGTGMQRFTGKMLSQVSLIQNIVASKVMWLDASRRGRLLDVGSGSGRYLVRMRDLGWDVAGVEPDPKAARGARERFGLEIHGSSLEAAGFSEGAFDAVTMHHVIEHVPDPIELLRRSHRVLKPGGTLVVVTPNIESLGRRMFSRSWMPWDPPRHLLLFSPRALHKAAELAGFRIERMLSPANEARDSWYFSYLIRKHEGGLPGSNIQKQLTYLLRLQGHLFWLFEHLLTKVYQCGEEVVMIAVKS